MSSDRLKNIATYVPETEVEIKYFEKIKLQELHIKQLYKEINSLQEMNAELKRGAAFELLVRGKESKEAKEVKFLKIVLEKILREKYPDLTENGSRGTSRISKFDLEHAIIRFFSGEFALNKILDEVGLDHIHKTVNKYRK